MKITFNIKEVALDAKFERWRDAVDPARTWTQPRYVSTGARVSSNTPGVGPLLMNAASLIAEEASRLAPRAVGYESRPDRSPGRLKRSMTAFLGRTMGLAIAAQDVKVEDAYYARWIHKGTQPHSIGSGMHPGSRSQPFFRDAIAAKKAEAREAIKAGLKRLLEAAK